MPFMSGIFMSIRITSGCSFSASTMASSPVVASPTTSASAIVFLLESLLRETAEKIPDTTLHIYDGVGHGVPKERKRRYEEVTLAFIDDHRGGSSGQGGRTVP